MKNKFLFFIVGITILLSVIGFASAAQAPIVQTNSATSITSNSAVINGFINYNGGGNIDERRFDWGTTSSCSGGWTRNVAYYGNSFSYTLYGLSPGTTYYFRAWAHNSAGWSYGNVLSFRTPYSCTNQCSSGQTRCNGNYKQSCINSNGCWIWGGDSYCSSGCAYGQCINNCIPKTCSQLGKNCGAWDNGCQQSIYCGSCSSGQICSNGVCQNNPVIDSYTVNFDVRNMRGFNDGVINANAILNYIKQRNSNSPLINEANIGQQIINSGLSYNVNPAFLVATAKLEGQFGTAGWASAHTECHNTMGWGIPSGSTAPNSINCVGSWGGMIDRVAYNIAYGSYYYNSGKYTVDQIRKTYAGQPNSQSIADIMNDLYNFAKSSSNPICTNQCSSGQTRCNGNYKQSCSDYNGDGCLEWGGDFYCSYGCSNNNCNSPTCIPKTCSQLGKNCGAWDNGCQQSINCGSCSSGQTCNSNGQCINSNPVCTNQCNLWQTRCNGQNSEMCRDYNSDGCYEWGGGVFCDKGCHGAGICNYCIPNSKFCDGNYLNTCNSDGSGSGGFLCPSGRTCSNGQCV